MFDWKRTSVVLLIAAAVYGVADCPDAIAKDKPQTPFEQASDAFKKEKYDKAAKLFVQVRDDAKTPGKRGKAEFNLAATYQAQHRYDRAIETYKKIFPMKVNDKEAGDNIMQPYRNYRPNAMWQIGMCHFAKGEYKAALTAFKTGKNKYPFQSWCGNGIGMYAYRYLFWQALCREHLGQPAKAVALYYQATGISLYRGIPAFIRVVEMYRAAGQPATLRHILAATDKRNWAKEKARAKKHGLTIKKKIWLTNQPTHLYRAILALYRQADRRHWDKLIAKLRAKNAGGPETLRDRMGNPFAVLAAQLLATAPKQTVPLLLKRLKKGGDGSDDKWVFYALGCCGTPKAVAVLKHRLNHEKNVWWYHTLVYSLGQAGKRGRAVLRPKLAKNPKSKRLQKAVQGDLAGEPWGVSFPALPKTLELPGKLADLAPAPSRSQSRAKVTPVVHAALTAMIPNRWMVAELLAVAVLVSLLGVIRSQTKRRREAESSRRGHDRPRPRPPGFPL